MRVILWPKEFEQNTLDFSEYEISSVLAMQLVAWGNVFMGEPRPDNFFEVMDAASKMTGAFTPDQCQTRCNILLAQRKNNKDDDYDSN